MTTPHEPRSAVPGHRALAVWAWVWLVFALPFLTDAACNILVGLLLLGSWAVLALAWLVLGLVGLPRSLGSRWWWASAVAGCLGVVLALTDVGLAARVALSRPWLEDYARQVPRDKRNSSHEPRWVGLFRVDGTENQGGAVFLYTGTGYLNRYGVAYIPPDERPRDFDKIRTRPLLGPWESFVWKF
jgi:hypothetical protein